ncbi:MAG: DUF4864 domain-containing protein [Hyphomicrobiales bacterium]
MHTRTFHLNLKMPLVSAVLLGVFLAPANALDITDADKLLFRKVIASQIEAFRRGDAEAAFSHASPTIKMKFGDAARFVQMAKHGYAPVYAPQTFDFAEVSDKLGVPTQHVRVIGPKGKAWLALYGFEQLADGAWKISGVILIRRPGAGA